MPAKGTPRATSVEETSGLLLTEEAEPRDMTISDDEVPGGSTPTPDQDSVEEIGKTIGLTYEDDEPLRAGEKEEERDAHRWELDPASSEDYGDRCSDAGSEAVPLLKMRHQHRSKRPA
jgi:hypothetical protein